MVNRWLNLRITQQFMVFFVITCIMPIGMVSALFFQSLDEKFMDRISSTLDTGLLLAEQVYQKNLEKLSVSTTEATHFTVRENYDELARTGSIQSLKKTLNRYFEMRSFDVLDLYDASGKKITRAGSLHTSSETSLAEMLKAAHAGKTVSALERFRFGEDELRLAYVSISPIFSEQGNSRVAGVLLVGESFDHQPALQEITRILPDLDLRIYSNPENSKGPLRLLYSSLENAPSQLPSKLLEQSLNTPIYKLSKDPKEVFPAFYETINHKKYLSKSLVLRNFANQPIGLLVVSTSEEDLAELKMKKFWLLSALLLCGALIIGVTGTWFKRTFVDPVVSLSRAADRVAEGQLDITVPEQTTQREIRNTIRSFNKMTTQLQEDQRLHHNFISALTHDLRTPLIAQKRVLEMYEELGEELPQDLKSLNVGLLKSNNHLLDMVNKILEAYQYDAGKIMPHPEFCALHEIVEEVILSLRAWADQKRITLINRISPDLPMGFWDRTQLRRVFQNLIANALENIQEDRQVIVDAIPHPEAVQISVSDNGPGISPETLPLIFTRYFTGDRRRQKIGSGLGLYICRRIIENHGGQIHAESQLGQGARFIINLPLKALYEE